MIRIVAEAIKFTSTRGENAVIAAKNRLESCVNKTKSGQGTRLLKAINVTLDALTGKMSVDTAIGFANAMDSFGVNLQKAAEWGDGIWGVSGKTEYRKNTPIPRSVFDSWVYKGINVDEISGALKTFWDANKELREGILGFSTNSHSYSLTSIPQDPELQKFFIEGNGDKINYGKYENAIAFICSQFNEETGENEIDGQPIKLAYLTPNYLDVMWDKKIGCEVKNNNQENSGFNLKGTETGKIEDCTYFKDYPGSSIAIYDEWTEHVCVCKNIMDLKTFVESTGKGGPASRQGMWILKGSML